MLTRYLSSQSSRLYWSLEVCCCLVIQFTLWNHRVILLVQLAALFTLVIIIAINLAVGILPHVDNFAHIGGFLSGFLLGFVFLIRPQFGWVNRRYSTSVYSSRSSSPKFKTYQYVLWVLSLILLIVGYASNLPMCSTPLLYFWISSLVVHTRSISNRGLIRWCEDTKCYHLKHILGFVCGSFLTYPES